MILHVDPEQYFLGLSKRITPKKLKPIKAVEITAATAKFNSRGNAYKHTKTGFRADLQINVRSGWEANVLRVLASYDIPFEFEPNIFLFPVKRGTKAYVPDIFLTNTGEWIEVKGYFDNTSRIKIKRFKKYYPEEFAKYTMIISKSSKVALKTCEDLGVPTVLFYEDISRLYKETVSNWEGR